jgi:hypothetical protein
MDIWPTDPAYITDKLNENYRWIPNNNKYVVQKVKNFFVKKRKSDSFAQLARRSKEYQEVRKEKRKIGGTNHQMARGP